MNINANFPQELTALPNWVCWRLERDTKHNRDAKVPYCPATGKRASPSNPATWGTLDEALYAASQYTYSGVGFMFTSDPGIIGIDIDHCISNGVLNEVAAAILAKLPSTYIEISPSGTGLHIFMRGKLPPGGNRNTKSGVEMYGSSRYFTMTGNRYSTCADSVAADTGVLTWIHSSYVKPRNPKAKAGFVAGFSSLPDDKLLEMARNSKDGAVFKQLWDGQWQRRYKSQSEADFALCCKLAFWTNRDEGQIDRLFRQSGLIREKWDIRHSAGGGTYGENTVSRACIATTETYAPPRSKNTNIIEQYGGYYRKKGDNIYQLSNFIIRPIEIIKAEQEAQLTCDFVCDDGVVYRQSFLGDDLCNLQKFKKVLNCNTISLCFFGTEGDLETFKDYLRSMDWKEKKGVKALGIYRHNGLMVFLMSPVSYMIIHNPATIAIGDSAEMLRAKATLDEIKEGIINAYETKTRLPREQISRLMDEESCFNAKKAVEFGFSDGILYSDNQPKDVPAVLFSRMAVTNSLLSKFPKPKNNIDSYYKRLDRLKY